MKWKEEDILLRLGVFGYNAYTGTFDVPIFYKIMEISRYRIVVERALNYENMESMTSLSRKEACKMFSLVSPVMAELYEN